MMLSRVFELLRRTGIQYSRFWDQFWFSPRLPDTLAVMRILTGAMLLYTHLVLASDLLSFVGEDAWINNEMARQLHTGAFDHWGRSYLWHLDSPTTLWIHHVATIVVTAAMMIGYMTRITAPAAWFLQLMYIHRLTGALFGLDQITTYAAMYLMLAPCGSKYSVDALLRKKKQSTLGESKFWIWMLPAADKSVATNISTRLLQIHLCVIYLFGGLAKARGETWWDGTAVWFAVANLEYQSLDVTWMARWPVLFSALSHTTLFWEIFYIALVWPRLTRPLVLLIAVGVHAGIALFLGMATFGIMMIIANMVFLEPHWVANLLQRFRQEPNNETDHDPSEFAGIEGTDEAVSTNEPAEKSLEEREELVKRRERKLRAARKRFKQREAKLKESIKTYRSRVSRLKRRETKIKKIAEQRRNRRSGGSDNDNPTPDDQPS